jgi:hypothetical protein
MADQVGTETFVAVLMVAVLLGMGFALFTYRYGVWKGHVAGVSKCRLERIGCKSWLVELAV